MLGLIAVNRVMSEQNAAWSAVDECNDELQSDPSNAKAYCNRGKAWIILHQDRQGLEDLSHSISLAPKMIEAYKERALCYKRQGEYEHAIEDLSDVIRLEASRYEDMNFVDGNNHVWTISVRAHLYNCVGEYRMAIKDYDRVLSLTLSKHENAGAYRGRGKANYNLGNYSDALSDFSESLKESSKSWTYCERGLVHLKTASLTKAMKDFNQAVELHSTSIQGLTCLGLALASTGNVMEAKKNFRKAVKAKPMYENSSDLVWRGIAHKELGQSKQAIACFTKSIEGKTEIQKQAQILRGDIYMSRGDLLKANEDYSAVGTLAEINKLRFVPSLSTANFTPSGNLT